MSDPDPTDDTAAEQLSPSKIDIAKLLEIGLYLGLAYTIVGVVYVMWQIELVGEVEAALTPKFTVFADLVAFGLVLTLWPVFLLSSLVCESAACGVF